VACVNRLRLSWVYDYFCPVSARWSCLAGIALFYVPLLAWVCLFVALFAWGGAFGLALMLLVAAVIGYAIFFLATLTAQMQHRGVRVTRQDQPELMAVVDNVMRQAEIKRLDGVWLAPEPGAWALRGRRDWLGRRHVGVAIGLLMAAHLSADELTAILAHEAGHLTDPNRLRHSLASRRRRACQKLKFRTSWPLRWYWRWVLKVTREQGLAVERYADAVAVRMCGADLAAQAQHRVAEASFVHAIAMKLLIRPCWERRIAPVTYFEAYEAVWNRAPGRVRAAVAAWMKEPEKPDDTHPGLAERCGGRSFPLAPRLRGDIPLAGLADLDRRFAVSLRWQEARYPMKTMTWDEMKAERASQKAAKNATAAREVVTEG
jgi:hypothetical protein